MDYIFYRSKLSRWYISNHPEYSNIFSHCGCLKIWLHQPIVLFFNIHKTYTPTYFNSIFIAFNLISNYVKENVKLWTHTIKTLSDEQFLFIYLFFCAADMPQIRCKNIFKRILSLRVENFLFYINFIAIKEFTAKWTRLKCLLLHE